MSLLKDDSNEIDKRWKPNVTVAAVICKDGKYLVVEEESNNQIVINQPAGHIEQDESLIESIKREVLEETAYEFVPEYLLGTYMYPNSTGAITYLRFCFTGSIGTHYPEHPLDDGILRALWLTYDDLKSDTVQLRSPMVLRCIEDYLAGNKYPLELMHHGRA